MTAAILLADLRRRGVLLQIAADGGLHYRAPAGVLRADDRRLLADHKAELLVLLREDLGHDGVDVRTLSVLAAVTTPESEPSRLVAWLLDSKTFETEFWLVQDEAALDVIRDEINGRPVVFTDELDDLRTKTVEDVTAILATKRVMGTGTRMVKDSGDGLTPARRVFPWTTP